MSDPSPHLFHIEIVSFPLKHHSWGKIVMQFSGLVCSSLVSHLFLSGNLFSLLLFFSSLVNFFCSSSSHIISIVEIELTLVLFS
ncbi:hypothetical protein V6Z12_A09G195700 [Gossypium hirsutum]